MSRRKPVLFQQAGILALVRRASLKFMWFRSPCILFDCNHNPAVTIAERIKKYFWHYFLVQIRRWTADFYAFLKREIVQIAHNHFILCHDIFHRILRFLTRVSKKIFAQSFVLDATFEQCATTLNNLKLKFPIAIRVVAMQEFVRKFVPDLARCSIPFLSIGHGRKRLGEARRSALDSTYTAYKSDRMPRKAEDTARRGEFSPCSPVTCSLSVCFSLAATTHPPTPLPFYGAVAPGWTTSYPLSRIAAGSSSSRSEMLFFYFDKGSSSACYYPPCASVPP